MNGTLHASRLVAARPSVIATGVVPVPGVTCADAARDRSVAVDATFRGVAAWSPPT